MKVFITGINGFTGQHLSKYLKNKGYDVEGCSKDNCDITKNLDIINKLKPDYIIHLAAISFANESDFFKYYHINTIGTENLLNSINYDVKNIIIASSAVVYGRQNIEIIDENIIPNPNNHYGISKFGAEQVTKNFTHLPITITRSFNYTGVKQNINFLIPKIVDHYKNNKQVIKLGNLNVIREFNDINFVCECYYRLLDKQNQIVNICSGRGIKLLDVIDIMNEIAGYKIKVEVDNTIVRKHDIKRLIGNPNKLFNLIGKVKQRDFKETLREMYEYSC